jgi:CheY-like chemotaxis protein
MPSGGTLRIETANARLSLSDLPDDAGAGPGDYIMFAVTDTGTGMPPEVLERVFDPFFTTKEPGKGSGLGLSMVYGVVRQSRGHVRIESEVGRGTTVRLYLPRVNDARDSAPGPIVEFAPRQPGETILVVEDNADVRTLAATMLASLGYRVLQADTAAAGLAILDTVEPDVLLTDVMLPELSGRELAERALRAQPGLKVVYMSGYTADEAIRNGHAGAAAPLLNKPFRKHELSAAIRAALDATPQQPTRTIGRAATG